MLQHGAKRGSIGRHDGAGESAANPHRTLRVITQRNGTRDSGPSGAMPTLGSSAGCGTARYSRLPGTVEPVVPGRVQASAIRLPSGVGRKTLRCRKAQAHRIPSSRNSTRPLCRRQEPPTIDRPRHSTGVSMVRSIRSFCSRAKVGVELWDQDRRACGGTGRMHC